MGGGSGPLILVRGSRIENDTIMNLIPIPTELKVDRVNIMLIKS